MLIIVVELCFLFFLLEHAIPAVTCQYIRRMLGSDTRVRAAEHFEENLIIRPLRDGRVASRFSFTTYWKELYLGIPKV